MAAGPGLRVLRSRPAQLRQCRRRGELWRGPDGSGDELRNLLRAERDSLLEAWLEGTDLQQYIWDEGTDRRQDIQGKVTGDTTEGTEGR